jgi:hypothetical protein
LLIRKLVKEHWRTFWVASRNKQSQWQNWTLHIQTKMSQPTGPLK